MLATAAAAGGCSCGEWDSTAGGRAGGARATVPALVYGYELIGSIKEISSLGLILTLGTLVVLHPRWLRGRPTGAIPFALAAAAGVSALGVGFGAWVLAAAAILAVVRGRRYRSRATQRMALALWIAVGVIVTLIAALPTWVDVSRSLSVAQSIA